MALALSTMSHDGVLSELAVEVEGAGDVGAKGWGGLGDGEAFPRQRTR
jgi:hypothetical protein